MSTTPDPLDAAYMAEWEAAVQGALEATGNLDNAGERVAAGDVAVLPLEEI